MSLISWYDGSLVVNSAVDFPASASSSATSFSTLLKSSTGIASVFPASTYGTVTVSNLNETTASKSASNCGYNGFCLLRDIEPVACCLRRWRGRIGDVFIRCRRRGIGADVRVESNDDLLQKLVL